MDKVEIKEPSYYWEPEQIVGLIGELAWPIVVLIIAWRFRGSIKSVITNFFNNNDLKEVSVGPSGITAKMEAAKQDVSPDKINMPTQLLPEGMDAESIKQVHTERSTKYSLSLLNKIQEHVNALDLTSEEKLELLSTEISIQQATLYFIDITILIFISQYNLFNKRFYPINIVTRESIEIYFREIKEAYPENYEEWDADRYIAWPLSIGMIEECEGGYRLCELGRAYVMHIRNNPNFLDHVALL